MCIRDSIVGNDSSSDDSADDIPIKRAPKPSSKGKHGGIAKKRREKARAKAYEEIPSQLIQWVSGI